MRTTSARVPRGRRSIACRTFRVGHIARTRRSIPRATAGASSSRCAECAVSELHIRKVRPDELEDVWRVHVASSNDGAVRRGGQATRPGDTPVAGGARAGLARHPDGDFCAVEDGQIPGMVSALVPGRLWYLS